MAVDCRRQQTDDVASVGANDNQRKANQSPDCQRRRRDSLDSCPSTSLARAPQRRDDAPPLARTGNVASAANRRSARRNLCGRPITPREPACHGRARATHVVERVGRKQQAGRQRADAAARHDRRLHCTRAHALAMLEIRRANRNAANEEPARAASTKPKLRATDGGAALVGQPKKREPKSPTRCYC